MQDMLGRTLNIGDFVFYANNFDGSTRQHMGFIYAFTPQNMRICFIEHNQKDGFYIPSYPRRALTSNAYRILKIDEGDAIYVSELFTLRNTILTKYKSKIIKNSNQQLKNLLGGT